MQAEGIPTSQNPTKVTLELLLYFPIPVIVPVALC